MINYKTKWNLPRTFNHCISPLLKSATHNNITPQINSLKLSPTPPRPFPQFTIPFPLTDQSEQIINLGHSPPIKTLSNTNIPASRHYHRVPQPNRRHTTTKTKTTAKIPINSLSTRSKGANPITNTRPNPDAHPIRKKRRHTPAPIPTICNTISINLAPSLRTHKRTKTNYKLQSTGLIRVFIPPLHDIHHSNPEPDFSQKRIAPP